MNIKSDKFSQKNLPQRAAITIASAAILIGLTACDNASRNVNLDSDDRTTELAVQDPDYETTMQMELDSDIEYTEGERQTNPYGNTPMNNIEDYSSSSRADYRNDINGLDSSRLNVTSDDYDRSNTYNMERSSAAGSNVMYDNSFVDESLGANTEVQTLAGETSFRTTSDTDDQESLNDINTSVKGMDNDRNVTFESSRSAQVNTIESSSESTSQKSLEADDDQRNSQTTSQLSASANRDSASNEMRRAESLRQYRTMDDRELRAPNYGEEIKSNEDEDVAYNQSMTRNSLVDKY